MDHFKSKVVSYFYDEEIGNFCLGGGNPMRPHRARLTHSLVENYGLVEKLKVFHPVPQEAEEIAMFHADEYVEFLNSVTPDNQDEYLTQLRRFNLGPVGEADCPVFDGLFDYCRIYSGASVNGAGVLSRGESDICLNWSGGMHHAKKAEASGFCYINDIVLGILELLKTHQRVLYVDIDIHHGDGVEEAFYLTDRVMTVSFHKYGDFFPGTGALGDTGYGLGKNYSLNVPLQEGMDDESYRSVFEPIMQKVMEKFQPGAVVICGGADSLSGDRLGCFNLSLEGHSNCMEFLGRFNVPMLVLGGGGYTMRNVARCWAYETGRLQGVDLPDKLPEGALQSFDYYMDTHNLRIATSNMKNGNSREMMDKIVEECLQNLQQLPAAPGAQFHVAPPLHKVPEAPEEDPDERGGGRSARERRVNKYQDNEDDGAAEEYANRHRGGRDTVLTATTKAQPVVKAEEDVADKANISSASTTAHVTATTAQPEAPAPMDVDEPSKEAKKADPIKPAPADSLEAPFTKVGQLRPDVSTLSTTPPSLVTAKPTGEVAPAVPSGTNATSAQPPKSSPVSVKFESSLLREPVPAPRPTTTHPTPRPFATLPSEEKTRQISSSILPPSTAPIGKPEAQTLPQTNKPPAATPPPSATTPALSARPSANAHSAAKETFSPQTGKSSGSLTDNDAYKPATTTTGATKAGTSVECAAPPIVTAPPRLSDAPAPAVPMHRQAESITGGGQQHDGSAPTGVARPSSAQGGEKQSMVATATTDRGTPPS